MLKKYHKKRDNVKVKVLFVCLGNICRSPAAEGVFLDLLEKKNLLSSFEIDSAGTGDWHIGDLPDKRMREAALERGIELTSRSRQIQKQDFVRFDHILVMDDSNFENVMKLTEKVDEQSKVKKFTDYQSDSKRTIVPDPYFGGKEGFYEVLDLVEECSKGFLNALKL